MTRSFSFLTAAILACAAATSFAQAQEAPVPAESPVPAAPPAPNTALTPMQRQYDGALHVTLAPYVWLPTVRQNVQYSIPTLSQQSMAGFKAGGVPIQSSVQVGPSDYASNINAAAMFSFEVRKGALDLFGDYIYANVSTTASATTTVRGPLGHVKIPISLTTNARLAASIWEIAAGFSLAHGNNADVNLFGGWRQFPLNLTLDYNAVVGKKGIVQPAGTVVESPMANDVIFGLRGKAFFNDHFYLTYYGDMGAGAINQTWEAFAGPGYMFDHGQTIVLAYRTLDYNAFPQNSPVQKLVMYGPLLGYTFQL